VPERTEWHNIVVWRKQAEFVEKYVHKGDKLYVEGKIQSRSYDDKQGVRRYVVEIMTETVDLLTSRQTSAQQPTAATSEPASSSVATPGADNDYPF
jgi:single-strand DNA-binding protein